MRDGVRSSNYRGVALLYLSVAQQTVYRDNLMLENLERLTFLARKRYNGALLHTLTFS